MKLKGTIKELNPNFVNQTTEIVIETHEPVINGLIKLMGKPVSAEIKQFSEHRTVTMNSYYWTLLGELAKVMKMGNAEMHNRMLRDYGVLEEIGGYPIVVEIPETEEAEKKVLHDEHTHLKPTSELRQYPDGFYRVHYLIRGSHSYSKDEFSRLLDGLIDNCKEQDIETATPDELARMRALWSQS